MEGEPIKAPLSTNLSEEDGVSIVEKTKKIVVGKWKISVGSQAPVTFPLVFPLSGFPSYSPFKLGIFHNINSHQSLKMEAMVFGSLKRHSVLPEFTKALMSYFPEIVEIDQIPYPDGSQGPVYLTRKDGKKLPLWAFGDGVRRWYYLLGAMVVHKYACHCIEEIEGAFHPEAQKGFSRFLVEYALKSHNQLFLTSHSIEFADAFLEALYGEKGLFERTADDPVRIFTLRWSGDPPSVQVWPFKGRDAYLKRESYALEFR
jgi:hypothetical protein